MTLPPGAAPRSPSVPIQHLFVLLLLFAPALTARAEAQRPRGAFSRVTPSTVWPAAQLATGVYAVMGDTTQGVEGRPNAGFVVADDGIIVVGGVASPMQGEALVRSIRAVSKAPIRWLVLYAHHPDMQFGAIALKRAGARVVAHPNTAVLASEAGPDQMVADWDAVVGLQEMLGFEFANQPDRPVTVADTLAGGRVVVSHPGDAHSAGDLLVWLPKERILFSGDVLVADGVPMVVDGSSRAMLAVLDTIAKLGPRIIVPGHGPVSRDPERLVDSTRRYITATRNAMKTAVEAGTPMRRALASLPPADSLRPVSLNSRMRRNANRIYVEMEREVMGLDSP